MNRGDTNNFTFKLYKVGTSPREYIDGSVYSEVEVQFNKQYNFNSIKKLKSEGDVTWDNTNSNFVVNLTQDDTFALTDGTCEVQVRTFLNDVCKGSQILEVSIGECLSSEVLDD